MQHNTSKKNIDMSCQFIAKMTKKYKQNTVINVYGPSNFRLLLRPGNVCFLHRSKLASSRLKTACFSCTMHECVQSDMSMVDREMQ